MENQLSFVSETETSLDTLFGHNGRKTRVLACGFSHEIKTKHFVQTHENRQMFLFHFIPKNIHYGRK